MDMLLVRRRQLTDSAAAFHCACGRPVFGWDTLQEKLVARCATCDRPEYHLLKSEPTELVIVARGVVLDDEAAFAGQGFHVRKPDSAMFVQLPTFEGELTRPDGSLKEAIPDHDRDDEVP